MTKTKTASKIVNKTATTKLEPAALAEVNRLNDQEARLALAILRKSEELAGVKAARGDLVLDAADQDGAARDAGRQVTALREEIDSLADAAHRARQRRVVAIPKVYIEEAEAKERQATELETEATRLEAEAKVLLAAVEDFAEWGFLPAVGLIDGRYFSQIPPSTEYRVIDGRGPRWTRMRQEAASLRSQAGPLRFKVAHAAGSVGGSSVEDVISAIHSDSLRVGPTAAALVAWIEQAIGSHVTNVPMRLKVEWREGNLDTRASQVIPVRPGASEVRVAAESTDTASAMDRILGEPAGAAVEA